jgi:hypothetical protein
VDDEYESDEDLAWVLQSDVAASNVEHAISNDRPTVKAVDVENISAGSNNHCFYNLLATAFDKYIDPASEEAEPDREWVAQQIEVGLRRVKNVQTLITLDLLDDKTQQVARLYPLGCRTRSLKKYYLEKETRFLSRSQGGICEAALFANAFNGHVTFLYFEDQHDKAKARDLAVTELWFAGAIGRETADSARETRPTHQIAIHHTKYYEGVKNVQHWDLITFSTLDGRYLKAWPNQHAESKLMFEARKALIAAHPNMQTMQLQQAAAPSA